MIIWVVKIFFFPVQFSCVFLPPLLNISASVRSRLFLSFIEPIFTWNVPLVSLIFLKRSLVFPILIFLYSFALITEEGFLISPCYSFISAFKWAYLSFSPLLFISLLFTGICKVFVVVVVVVWHLFFLEMVLISVSCTVSWTSIHGSSVSLSDLIPRIYFLLPLYNPWGSDSGHTWMV